MARRSNSRLRIAPGGGGNGQHPTEGPLAAGPFVAGVPAAAVAPAPGTGGWIDLRTVERLASRGLTEEEVLAELGRDLDPPPGEAARLDAAMRRGRALGAAAIKQAQYDAALEGSVSAQAHVLKLLEAPEDGGEVRVTVDRVVISDEEARKRFQA